MRAYVFILMAITGTMLMSCHDTTEGYLKTDSARYVPDTMENRLQLQGVIGTSPIEFEVVEVEATEGGNAELFRHLVNVRGGGRMEFPLISDITPGRYRVSLSVFNEGYSHIVKDVFTFIVK